MITLSELWRRVQNVVTTARVLETMASDGKMLVIVLYTDQDGVEHKSKWLPVMTKNNSFMKIWMPPLVDEQVLVLRPFGENDKGIVIASIHWKGSKEPLLAHDKIAIVEFSDGAIVYYDAEKKEMFIKSMELIKVECIKAEVHASESVLVVSPDVTVECDTAKITATLAATVISPLVTLDCDDLHVTGDTQIDGNMTINETLLVKDDATIEGNADVGMALDVATTVTDYMGVLSNFITSNGGTRVS